jgi:hypothetical protein
MKRRAYLSSLAALFAIAVIFCTGTREATAQQNPQCCVFYVDIAGFPPSCFPANLWTDWTGGVSGPVSLIGNATFPFPAVFAVPQPCPPAADFKGVSLAGEKGPWATFNNPVQFNVGRCCFIARVSFDQNGCVYITIRPC